MTDMTTYAQEKILEHVLGITPFTFPTFYVALFTDNSSSVEVTGGSYARQAANWGVYASLIVPTDADMTFSALPAVTVNSVAIMDALTGGNAWWKKDIHLTPITVAAGEDLFIATADLSVGYTA
jgi:hypothetical protein